MQMKENNPNILPLHFTIRSPAWRLCGRGVFKWRVWMRSTELQSWRECCIINSAAGRAVVKIWFTVGGCPVAVTTQKCSSHTSLPFLCSQAHMCTWTCVAPFCLHVYLVCACVCTCLSCQPVMENVLGLLPHFMAEEIWLKWTPLVLIGRGLAGWSCMVQ